MNRLVLVATIGVCGCLAGGESTEDVAAKKTPKPPKDRCKPGKVKKQCTTTTATVGPTGGTVTTPDGVTMQVPYGALDDTTVLSITATTLDPDPALGGVGTVYAFEPEGLVFARPVAVALPLPAGMTSASIYWTKLNSEDFEPIGGTLAGGTITASTFHFSLAQVGAPVHSPVIRGQQWTTWISEYGRKNRASPTEANDIEAIVADGANFASFAASPVPTSDTDPTPLEGEFKIENVPTGGEFIVHIVDHDGLGDRYVVTADTVIDLGSDRGGDPDRAEVYGMDIDLTVDLDAPAGTSTWNDNSTLEMATTRGDDFGFGLEVFDVNGDIQDSSQIPVGAHSANMTFDLQDSGGSVFASRQILGSQGDNTVVAQLTGELSSTNVPYQSMRWVGHFPLDIDVTQAASPTPVSVDLTTDIRATPKTLDVDFRGDHFWDAIRAETTTPIEPFSRGMGVVAQGYDASEGFYTGNLDLLLAFEQGFTGTPCVRANGAMQYGDSALLGGPTGGTFGDLFLARCNTRVRYKLPGTLRSGGGAFGPSSIQWTRAVPTTAGMVIEPPLTPPHNVQIDGRPFAAGGAVIGTSRPTITWEKPVTGKDAAHCTNPDVDATDAEACITYYTVTARELSVNANQVSVGTVVARVVTPNTSFQFPDILDGNKTYAFSVGVDGGTTGDAVRRLRAMPLRPTLDEAFANVSSGVFGDAHGDVLDVQTLGESQFPMGLVIDGTQVFWIEHGESPWDEPIQHTLSGRLWRAPADGSAPAEILVDSLPDPQSISIDNGTVYWTNMGADDGSIQFVDAACTAPCSAQTLIDHIGGVSNGNGLVVKAGDVFWLGQGVQVIRAADPCRSSPIACSPQSLSPGGGVSIDADADNVYWTDYGAGEVLAVPRGGGLVHPIANGGANPWDVHVGTGAYAGFVFYGNQAWQQPIAAFIGRVPRNNADPSANQVTVATGRALGTDDPPSEIMKVFGIDATDAYYIDTYDRLMRAPLDGSGPVLVGLLSVGGCPQGNIVVRDRTVYWTDTCSQAAHYFAVP